MKNIIFERNCVLKWFVICTHNEFFNNSCIFGKISARAFRKPIISYKFEAEVKRFQWIECEKTLWNTKLMKVLTKIIKIYKIQQNPPLLGTLPSYTFLAIFLTQSMPCRSFESCRKTPFLQIFKKGQRSPIYCNCTGRDGGRTLLLMERTLCPPSRTAPPLYCSGRGWGVEHVLLMGRLLFLMGSPRSSPLFV